MQSDIVLLSYLTLAVGFGEIARSELGCDVRPFPNIAKDLRTLLLRVSSRRHFINMSPSKDRSTDVCFRKAGSHNPQDVNRSVGITVAKRHQRLP